MNHRILVAFVIAIFLGNAIAEPISFTREKFVNALNTSASDQDFKRLPLFVIYPSGFTIERRDVKGLGMLFIRSQSTDVGGFINGTAEESLGGGFFTIALALNVGYIPGSEKFTSEDDPQAIARMESAGMKNIISKRRDKNGIPILETTADFQNGRHIYLAYIALGNSRSAFRITYYHPKVHTERDIIVWRTFIDGLGG